ncbi:zinc-alpha-2-glycoprotein isoform X2 [Peromyscus maniculatus bairdii]|uniref:zinc-alpha-2-glycoprotein isoform X2 n=1 Tax=Peromyscus maniculatus bairdii TaxID=230844 RepID=UPI00042AF94E|nr:zinc-alpha-2-glycoprotein isoform X2 [Peromyscus maniculatus bairdii]
MVPVLLSLPLLLGPAVLQETGPYSLIFLYTGLSRPSKGIPRFQATAFLNDQAFFHYDSNSRKAEPVGPWSQVEGMEDWEKESQLQRAREEIFLVTLKDIMDYYKDSAVPAAENTKLKWEAEKVYTQRAKAYLEEECPTMLKRYLNYSRSHLDRKDPPTVTITSRAAPGRNRTFKCLAYDFYPQGISLHWNRAGKMLASKSGGVFPNGNGTYLSWVEVEVPPQDKDPYFCHIEHSGLSQSLSVQWDDTKKAKAESNPATQSQ